MRILANLPASVNRHSPGLVLRTAALRAAEIAAEAGILDGVFNVAPGAGSILGPAPGRHMGVDMAAFTGSTSVGRDKSYAQERYSGLKTAWIQV